MSAKKMDKYIICQNPQIVCEIHSTKSMAFQQINTLQSLYLFWVQDVHVNCNNITDSMTTTFLLLVNNQMGIYLLAKNK